MERSIQSFRASNYEIESMGPTYGKEVPLSWTRHSIDEQSSKDLLLGIPSPRAGPAPARCSQAQE